MKKHILTASARVVAGRKVKTLRKQGLVPATIYGKKIKSVSVSVPNDAFVKVYKEAGATGLIELTVDSPRARLPARQGEAGKEVRPVLTHNVQVDPVSSALLHVEFYQVDLKEKVHANVSLEVVGVPPAVAQKIGVLLTVLNEVEVEALPTDLPEKIAVDVSGLAEINQEINVVDLSVPSGVTVLTDGNLTVAKIGSLVTKEAEAQAAAEEAAAAAAQAPAEGEAAPTGEANVAPAAEATGATEKKPEEKK
jgi:large subunit ribosomal protein L25